MELKELMELIEESWTFDENNHPGIDRLSADQVSLFAVRHILMHQQKAVGRLVEAYEPTDHWQPLIKSAVLLAVRNSLVNTLRLASTIGLKASELEGYVLGWAKEHHTP